MADSGHENREDRQVARYWLIVALALSGACLANAEQPDESAFAVPSGGKDAFTFPIPALVSKDRRLAFFIGKRLFNTNWQQLAKDGYAEVRVEGHLGDRESCASCHVRNGRGDSPRLAPDTFQGADVKLVMSDGKAIRLHTGATVSAAAPRLSIQYQMVPGNFLDGAPYSIYRPIYATVGSSEILDRGGVVDFRVAPAVYGVGLLQLSSELTDGVGCFGWKCSQPSVLSQTAHAFKADIGVISSKLVQSNFPWLVTGKAESMDIALMSKYVSMLAVPMQRDYSDSRVAQGKTLFSRAMCDQCHVQRSIALNSIELPELSGLSFSAFTDLRLHDMGAGLASGTSPLSHLWRTPPLWGLGLVQEVNPSAGFLHDGRAATILEAVLWHSGEASASHEVFIGFSEKERNSLLQFLYSL